MKSAGWLTGLVEILVALLFYCSKQAVMALIRFLIIPLEI